MKRNAIANYITLVLVEIVTVCVGVLSRAVFLRKLGLETLGIAGLFSSVLAVLSLGNLGLPGGLGFAMTHAIAKNDKQRLGEIYLYAKKIFRIIQLILLILSVALMPFLRWIVEKEIDGLYVYYAFFVTNVLLSYLSGPETALYGADQNVRLISRIGLYANLITTALQIVLLYVVSSYYLYLCIMLVGTAFNVIFVKIRFSMDYKYLKYAKGVISGDDKKFIINRVRTTLVAQIAGSAVGSTDNLAITKFVGLAEVGIYNNYMLIANNLRSFAKNAFESVKSGVMQKNVNSGVEEKNAYYEILLHAFHLMGAFLTCCMYCLIQEFCTLVFGRMLDMSVVTVIALDLYIKMMSYAQSCCINTSSLYDNVRVSTCIGAGINVALSIILGLKCGIFGIVLATVISRVVCTYPYNLYLIYKKYLNKNIWEGVVLNLKCIIQFLLISGVTYIGVSFFAVESIPMWILKGFLTAAVTAGLLLALNYNNICIKMVVSFAKSKLKRDT